MSEDMNKKTLFLGDIHTGLSNDDPWYHGNLYTVLQQVVKHCVDNGITQILQAGDIFDVRKATTQTTMNFIRMKFIPLLEENGIHMVTLVGNHDAQFKDTIIPNASREILGGYSCVTVVDTPMTINMSGVDVDIIPWICERNAGEIFDFIKKSKSRFCMGHFELSGYYFYKNSKADHGLEPDFLKSYERVYSGHYHHANEGDNVFYIGTPLTMTANDEDETRGFYEFSGKSELVFIPNPVCHHRKISYPENKDMDLETLSGCAVRLFVNSVDDHLSAFQTKLESVAHSVSITDNISSESDVDADFEIETSYSLMLQYIEGMNHTDQDKQEIKKIVSSLYSEVGSNAK